MRNVRRLAAIVLAALLLCLALPEKTLSAALAEAEEAAEPQLEELQATEEIQVEELPAEIAEPEPEPEPEAPKAQPAESETAAPAAPEPEPAAPQEELPVILTDRDATYSPAFAEGYAALLRDARAYASVGDSEHTAELPRSAIVYVSARRTTAAYDRLEASFARPEGGSATLWLDAVNLRPLDEVETVAFVEACLRDKNVECYRGNSALPLAQADCRWIEAYALEEAVAVEAGQAEAAPPALSLETTAHKRGVTETWTIVPRFSDGAAHPVRFATSQKRVATVTDAGVVKGVRAGTATITVADEFGGQATVAITVGFAPSSVALVPKSLELGVGDETTLTATLSKNSAGAVRFVSSAPDVAAVDAAGRVKALRAGTATITATTYNNKKATAQVAVYAAPDSVRLEADATELGVGQTAALRAALTPGSRAVCAYASSAPEIASVDAATGVVRAVAPGTAKITVSTRNGCTDSLTLTVYPAPTGLTLDANTLTLGVGQVSEPLPVRLQGAADCRAQLTYATSNKKVASVDGAGRVTALRYGKATITVTSHNGHKAALALTVKPAPKSVKVQPAAVTLGVGEHLRLRPELNNGAAAGLRYENYDAAVLAVSTEGEITALAPGATQITVRTHNNKTASCAVTVRPAPESVSLRTDNLTLGIGQRLTLEAVLNAGSAGACSFSSDNPAVARIESGSQVVAVASGAATVTATTYNGRTASCRVTVRPAPSQVRVNPANLTLGVNESVDLQVQLGAPGEDCAGDWTLKSSNAKIVSVGAGGRVTALRAGNAKLTVTTHNGKTATVKVTVKKAPTGITMTPASVELGVGERSALKYSLPKGTVGGVHLLDYDGAIISVSGGTVTALREGATRVVVETYNGKQAACAVTVKPAPTAIALNPTEKTLGAGETFALAAALSPGAAGSVNFSSSDSAVASVDAGGRVKALKPGTAVLSATAYNGVTAACAVTVKRAPTGVAFAETSLTLAAGDSRQLAAPLLKGDAACANFTFKSGNTKVAQVTNAGRVTGIKPGSANLTVATYNGKKAYLKVTVKAAPTAIRFAEAEKTLNPGDAFAPALSFEGEPGSYALSVSDGNVLKIGADGKSVTAANRGTATLTATSYNGKTAAMTIHVVQAPDSVALRPESLTLGAGDGARLTAVMPEGQTSELTFASANAAVAAVDGSGRVTAVSPGAADITVRTANGKTATCRVTVLAAPTQLRLNPASIRQAVDEGDARLTVSFGAAGEGGAYTLTSSDARVVTVDASGRVIFRSPGAAKLIATTYNGLTAECPVEVSEAPSGMRFAREQIEIALGDTAAVPVTFAVGAGRYTLEVLEGSNIVSVNGDRATARAMGMARLRATCYNGLTATCMVRVVAPPESVALDQTEAELTCGDTMTLKATVQPNGIGSVRFASSDPSVARVDAETGIIKAVGMGTCAITATTYDGGCQAICQLKVKGILDGVTIGIDPGHQAKANMAQEAVAPGSSTTKFKVSGGCAGVNSRTPEYVIVLDVGLLLRDRLTALGAEVYMTRTTADVDISNQQRAIMMNEYGVDLVLRLHCNSYTGSHRGISMWVRSSGTGAADCLRAAELLLPEMLATTGAASDGVHKSNTYTGLNWSTVPSVLVEMGYLSDPTEDRLLNTPEYQAKLADGMVNGICAFMNRPKPADIQ